MSVETLPRPKAEQQKKESIFTYYSVHNEIDFIQKTDQISEKDKRFYIEENVFRFLGEFAGKVPYTSISYILNKDKLTYAGIDLSNSYEHTAALAGKGSREEDELVGHRNINYGLSQGYNVAQISPPKIADYGFVFYFQQDPHSNRVKEYILRYDEAKESTSNSKIIQEKIDLEPTSETTSDFLRNPTYISPENPQDELDFILRAAGISEKDIANSRLFEEQTRKELSPWIQQYVDAIFNGNVSGATYLLRGIYNRAVDIKKEVDNEPGFALSTRYAIQNTHHVPVDIHRYSSQNAMVTGGGSCPVTQNSWQDPLLPTNIIDTLVSKNTINNALTESSHFICPKCDYHANGPVGDECPGCHLTKQQYAESGNTVC